MVVSLWLSSVPANNVCIGEQISNNTYLVNEEATASSTCSSRRNIQPLLSAIGSVSPKNVQDFDTKSFVHAAKN